MNIIIKTLKIFFIVLLFSIEGFAQKFYDFNQNCQRAYDAIISLNFEQGQYWVQQERSSNPDNLLPILLEHYLDCLPILFNGDPKDYEELKPRVAQRLKDLEVTTSPSPWILYSKAAINFQWAACQIRMNEMTKGGRDFRRSYLLIKENMESYPHFSPNIMLLGIEEALIGTVPDNYRWLARLLGLNGHLRSGIQKVKSVALNPDAPFRKEAQFYYANLDFYLGKNKKSVWNFIHQQKLDLRNNHLFTYMVANFSIDDFQSTRAQKTITQRNNSSEYFKVHFFDYLLAIAYFNNLDTQGVNKMQDFLKNYKGKVFTKNAHYRLTLFYISTHQTSKARTEKERILTQGTTQFDADIQAQRFAQKSDLPNPYLIQARLKNEGGYTDAALQSLGHLKYSQLRLLADQLEYHYRYGRIYKNLGNYDAAAIFYKKCIELGRNSEEQFAARSALELAEMYEENNQKTLAKQYYQICLSMKNHDFQSAIDQRAKSGLARL